MRNLALIAALFLAFLATAPVWAEPHGEATVISEVNIPDPFAPPADLDRSVHVIPPRLTRPALVRTPAAEPPDRVLEVKRQVEPAPPTRPQPPEPAPRGEVPPVPALDLRGF